MIFMLMAAHDTTTLSLTAILYYLGKHPDWQQRVRAECQALQRPALRHEDLATLELTDRVIKESLRLFSPVHGIPRRTVKDVEVAELKSQLAKQQALLEKLVKAQLDKGTK